MQRPRVILALGAYVPGFLAPLAPQLRVWEAPGSFRERDAAATSLIEGVMFDSHEDPVIVVSLVHPSFRRLSLQHRTWGDLAADDAEIAMVRAALDRAGIERAGEPAPRLTDTRIEPEQIVDSAIRAVEGILPLDILPKHKRELISAMIWKITEAEGKYSTRYRSTGARDAGPGIKLQHEHVFTRADLTDEVLARPAEAEFILRGAVACVVTVDEHLALTRATKADPTLKGWARYKVAGVEVVEPQPGDVD